MTIDDVYFPEEKKYNRKDVKMLNENNEGGIVNCKAMNFIKEEKTEVFKAWINPNGSLEVNIKAKDIEKLRKLVDSVSEMIRGY